MGPLRGHYLVILVSFSMSMLSVCQFPALIFALVDDTNLGDHISHDGHSITAKDFALVSTDDLGLSCDNRANIQ